MNMLRLVACISLLISSLNFQAKDIFADIIGNNCKAVRAWLKTEPNLYIYNDQGQSVLHVAVLSNNYKIVKMLQASRFDVNLLNLDGKTALDLAIEHGSNKIAFFLMKKKSTVTSQDNLDQAKILLKNRYKKIMRIFWIIAPIVILTMPLWIVPYILSMSGICMYPMSGICKIASFVMFKIFNYMWIIPIYASTWKEKRFYLGSTYL